MLRKLVSPVLFLFTTCLLFFSCRHLDFVLATAHLYADVNNVPIPKPIDMASVQQIVAGAKVPPFIPSNKVMLCLFCVVPYHRYNKTS